MAEWHDDKLASAQIKHDDTDVPDDWEADLEEKVCSFDLFSFLNIYSFSLNQLMRRKNQKHPAKHRQQLKIKQVKKNFSMMKSLRK
jgi:hypothetical protein